jgi:hypothetical protein
MNDDGWITDKDAIFTLFQLRGIQVGDEVELDFKDGEYSSNPWNNTVIRTVTIVLDGRHYVDILSTKNPDVNLARSGEYNWTPNVENIVRWRPYVPQKTTD